MGSSPSRVFSSAKRSQDPFHSSSTLTSEEIQICETIWEKISSLQYDSPSPNYRSFRCYFYSNCYLNLKDEIPIPPISLETPEMPSPISCPIALHTIIIFVLKVLPLYFTTVKSNQKFQKYSKALALSSNHLGILPEYLVAFQKAFLLTILSCFPEQPSVYSAWCQLFQDIMGVLVPACQRHEAQTTMKRPLRLSGGSHLRDAPEHEIIQYYADYSFKLILTSGDEEEDRNSINCRLLTSLDNSIDHEYYDSYKSIGSSN